MNGLSKAKIVTNLFLCDTKFLLALFLLNVWRSFVLRTKVAAPTSKKWSKFVLCKNEEDDDDNDDQVT